jgi:hypothetical protein
VRYPSDHKARAGADSTISDGEIETILYEIGRPVCEVQIQFEVGMGMGRCKAGEHRGDAEAPKQDRHRHAQPSCLLKAGVSVKRMKDSFAG